MLYAKPLLWCVVIGHLPSKVHCSPLWSFYLSPAGHILAPQKKPVVYLTLWFWSLLSARNYLRGCRRRWESLVCFKVWNANKVLVPSAVFCAPLGATEEPVHTEAWAGAGQTCTHALQRWDQGYLSSPSDISSHSIFTGWPCFCRTLQSAVHPSWDCSAPCIRGMLYLPLFVKITTKCFVLWLTGLNWMRDWNHFVFIGVMNTSSCD